MKRELIVPPDADSAAEAIEMFRGWMIDGKLQCSLQPAIWRDTPEARGILLADAAHHVTLATAELTGRPASEILAGIKLVLFRELASPTSEQSGGFEG